MKLNIYYFNTTIVLGTALFVGGCAKNPAENVTPAQVSAPATNAGRGSVTVAADLLVG